MKKIKIHKEGYRLLTLLGIVLIVLNIGVEILFPEWNWMQLLVKVNSIAVFLFSVYFFRNPFREILFNDGEIIAPADGKIVVAEEVVGAEYFGDKRLQVSIFMSPANVHVNRNPISGIVEYVRYHPGKYLVAWHPKSSEKNERNSVLIKNNDIEVLVTQIAGKIARRIVNYANVGDSVQAGAEFGFIKFGSRVDLFLPLNTDLCVNLNQKVRGGQTVIGRLKK